MPSQPSWSRGFRAFTGLSFNINVQSRLKLHSEVVLPDDDSLKPALYQGLIEGLYCVNSFGSIQTNWKVI